MANPRLTKAAATRAQNRAAGIPTNPTSAARWAAWRAKKAAAAGGTQAPPRPQAPRPTPPPFTPPQPKVVVGGAGRTGSLGFKAMPRADFRAARLDALLGLEKAFILKLAESSVTSEAREKFEQYKQLKARALSPAPTPEIQNENDTALRVSVISLVKLLF